MPRSATGIHRSSTPRAVASDATPPGPTGGVTSRASGSVNAAPVALPTNTPSRITRYALEPGAACQSSRGGEPVASSATGWAGGVRSGVVTSVSLTGETLPIRSYATASYR